MERDFYWWVLENFKVALNPPHAPYSLTIAHFGKEWQPGTQTRHGHIYGIIWGDANVKKNMAKGEMECLSGVKKTEDWIKRKKVKMQS